MTDDDDGDDDDDDDDELHSNTLSLMNRKCRQKLTEI